MPFRLKMMLWTKPGYNLPVDSRTSYYLNLNFSSLIKIQKNNYY